MSEFIEGISFTQFKSLKANELKELQSFEVNSDGEHLMTVIIPQTDFVRSLAEEAAILSNSVGGKGLKEYLLKLEPVS